MPNSSTNAVYNGSTNDPAQPHATDGHTSHSLAINRFLADPEQRCPVEFSTVQTQVEAEAAGEARMLKKLHAFEQRFYSDNKVNGEKRAN